MNSSTTTLENRRRTTTRQRQFTHASQVGEISRRHFVDCSFTGMEWRNVVADDVQFENCRFINAQFVDCTISSALWLKCTLQNVVWQACTLERCNMIDSTMQNTKVVGGHLRYCNLNRTQFKDLTFENVMSKHCVMTELSIQHLQMLGGVWRDDIWAQCRLTALHADGCELLRSVFADCPIDESQWSKCSGSHVRWTKCSLTQVALRDCSFVQPAWSGSHWGIGEIERCTLPNACLDNTTLQQLRVVDTTMSMALFDAAKLTECEFVRLQAGGISLRGASLQQVNLRNALLDRLDACGASLQNVDLRGAQVRNARLLRQDQKLWINADVEGSQFQEETVMDEMHWWEKHQPGVRESLS